MAIAGVGSFSRSLTDGLAREGRVILGGDLSFTLIHREADDAERELPRRARPGFGRRHHARDGAHRGRPPRAGRAQGGGWRLSAVRRACSSIPTCRSPTRSRGATARSARRSIRRCWRGSTSSRARASRIGGATHRNPAVHQDRAGQACQRIAFGPRVIVSEDALRATGLLQPGSLVRWHYRLRLAGRQRPRRRRGDRRRGAQQLPDAGWEIRSRTNASPALERNVERFTQYPHPGRPHRAAGRRGRRRQRGEKPYRPQARRHRHPEGAGRHRRPRVRDLSLQVLLLSAVGAAIGLAARRGACRFVVAAAFGAIIPLPIAPALHPGELALALLYGLLTALAFALWPLGRAHDVPVSALFRDAVAPGARWPRRRYVVATAWWSRRSATVAVTLAYDRRIALIFVGAAAAVFVLLQLVADAADGGRAAAAACARDRVAARHRQHPSAGRADADHRAVARPRPRAARHA